MVYAAPVLDHKGPKAFHDNRRNEPGYAFCSLYGDVVMSFPAGREFSRQLSCAISHRDIAPTPLRRLIL